ncbi:DUF724 domain-containing protein 2-like [Solanum pennellii]|uniref:DUF724 domain-containing protein 2-like n=1 Tax=Solanum pennellii TaxID=28526 RepID=A0ABM1H0C2_SOLPN|nr:DUF724 domain-containing protein 2-like [Solanum pennellii]
MAEPNDANENHQLIIDIISDNIRETAYKKQETTLIFQINDDIEVASQEEGYIGSYYQASIVHPIGAYHYKVKYKTLVNDDKTTPLEESVHVSEVRPIPPAIPHETRPMEIYEIVDVYANEGWWFGVITAKVEQDYYVYFPTTEDTVAYSIDKLRVHQEWSDGNWIIPLLR